MGIIYNKANARLFLTCSRRPDTPFSCLRPEHMDFRSIPMASAPAAAAIIL